MQLVIYGSKHTIPDQLHELTSDNNALSLSSVKMSKANAQGRLKHENNYTYQQVVELTLKTRYGEVKECVDDEMVKYLQDEFKKGYSQLKSAPKTNKEQAHQNQNEATQRPVNAKKNITGGHAKNTVPKKNFFAKMSGGLSSEDLSKPQDDGQKYHEILHIYTHGSTLGLSFDGPKNKGLSLTPKNLALLLEPYLKEHPECNKIKLHVCFSGLDYDIPNNEYGKKFTDEIQNLTVKENGITQEVEVEAVNGMSIIGEKPKGIDSTRLGHFAITATKAVLEIIKKAPQQQMQNAIIGNSVPNNPKPKWRTKIQNANEDKVSNNPKPKSQKVQKM